MLHLTRAEFATFLLAAGALLAVARIFLRSRRRALAVALLSLPALYLAVERGSQFTTADEKRILREMLQWSAGSKFRDWNLGANRTSTLLMTPVAGLVRALPNSWQLEDRLALLKNIHWMYAFLLFLILVVLTHAAFDLTHEPTSWLLLVYGLLLLPVTLMALKIVNYDKFALLLSAVSLLLVILAVRRQSVLAAHLAVVAGYLGAQEKLSASPFLLLSMVFFVYVLLRDRRSWPRAVYAALAPLGLCALVGGMTTLVALATRSFDTDGFRHLGYDLTDPLVYCVWPVQRLLTGGHDFSAYRWPHLGVVVASFLAGGIGLLLLQPVARNIAARISARQRGVFLVSLLAAVLATGLWGTFQVVAYWHPHRPIQEGEFNPGGEFNHVILHFAAHTHAQHVWRAIAFHYAVFINALPTVLVVLALLLVLFRFRRAATAPWVLDLMVAAALIVPLGWALCNMPFGHRYLSFGLLPLALGVLVLLLKSTTGWTSGQRAVATVAVALAVLLEVAPFAPAYFAFRPLWSPHDYPDAQIPIPGRLNPTWLGWGEETMICGQMLQQRISTSSAPAGRQAPVLYVANCCDWLTPHPALEVRPLVWYIDRLKYDDTEYYLLNRSCIVQRNWLFPQRAAPEFVLSYRGFVQAWVFRGDKLRAAGYRFASPATWPREPDRDR
jgi:hypothetical protein